MNITEIVQSSGWKNFMSKLYGFGAAVVIIGAMFKIMHWPGASAMIVIGLTTEAVIFFFSAFEPPHEELDWTLVYPELAGLEDPEDVESYKDHKAVDPAIRKKEHTYAAPSNGGGGAGLLNIPELDDATLTKLGEGLTKLSASVGNLNDISEASVATKEYLDNVRNAAVTVKSLEDTYQQTNDTLKESTAQLSNSYFSTAELISKSGTEVEAAYAGLAQSLNTQSNGINQNGKSFGAGLEALNKNISALNTSYELQLQENNKHLNETRDIYKGLDEMTRGLKESAEETIKYKEQVSKLSSNLAALNDIYGNMLSAVNVLNNK